MEFDAYNAYVNRYGYVLNLPFYKHPLYTGLLAIGLHNQILLAPE